MSTAGKKGMSTLGRKGVSNHGQKGMSTQGQKGMSSLHIGLLNRPNPCHVNSPVLVHVFKLFPLVIDLVRLAKPAVTRTRPPLF